MLRIQSLFDLSYFRDYYIQVVLFPVQSVRVESSSTLRETMEIVPRIHQVDIGVKFRNYFKSELERGTVFSTLPFPRSTTNPPFSLWIFYSKRRKNGQIL